MTPAAGVNHDLSQAVHGRSLAGLMGTEKRLESLDFWRLVQFETAASRALV